MKYGVWCEVYGGVTGHRAAWLRGRKGRVAKFETMSAAQEVAARYQAARDDSQHQTAIFSYSAKEMTA